MSHNIHKHNKTAKIRAERILTVINEVRVTGLEPKSKYKTIFNNDRQTPILRGFVHFGVKCSKTILSTNHRIFTMNNTQITPKNKYKLSYSFQNPLKTHLNYKFFKFYCLISCDKKSNLFEFFRCFSTKSHEFSISGKNRE